MYNLFHEASSFDAEMSQNIGGSGRVLQKITSTNLTMHKPLDHKIF